MSTVRLKCAGAEVLFFEPDGLLLCATLVPVDEHHGNHQLSFQLSYLGVGNITVHVAVEGGAQGGCGAVTGIAPTFAEAVLRGATTGTPPGMWLTSVVVPDTNVQYRLTVWGQPGADDRLRGELVADISGYVPLLTATTRATVTYAQMPECVVLNGPW